MSSISIRRAGSDDWAAIAAIHSASWRTAYRGIYPDSYLDEEAPEERRRFWRSALAEMDPELDAVFLAEDEAGTAIGFACVRREAEAAGPLLDNLHVLPERKGGGIGRRLIAAAEWLVGKEREAALQLVVWKDNVAARGFYARLGGREVEEFEAPTAGGGSAPQLRVRWERAAELVR